MHTISIRGKKLQFSFSESDLDACIAEAQQTVKNIPEDFPTVGVKLADVPEIRIYDEEGLQYYELCLGKDRL